MLSCSFLRIFGKQVFFMEMFYRDVERGIVFQVFRDLVPVTEVVVRLEAGYRDAPVAGNEILEMDKRPDMFGQDMREIVVE